MLEKYPCPTSRKWRWLREQTLPFQEWIAVMFLGKSENHSLQQWPWIVKSFLGGFLPRISRNILNILKLPEMVLLIESMGLLSKFSIYTSLSYKTSRWLPDGIWSRENSPSDPLDSRTIRGKEFIQHGHYAWKNTFVFFRKQRGPGPAHEGELFPLKKKRLWNKHRTQIWNTDSSTW